MALENLTMISIFCFWFIVAFILVSFIVKRHKNSNSNKKNTNVDSSEITRSLSKSEIETAAYHEAVMRLYVISY